ncbi:unnamed protein product [Prunus armeniaca]
MHHGGRLIHQYYVDGTVTYFDYVDKDNMSLTEIDCMAVYLGHIGRIDYWYRVEDEGDLKRVEFDSEVIQMCENVPEVRMINMYMDHRDNIDDVLNSQTDSNVYCRYSSQLYHYADDVRSPGSVQHETNRDTSKGKENVVAIDEGCVQHDTTKATSKGKQKVVEVDEGFVDAEINEVRRSVRKRNPSIQQEADDADDSSETDDESDPDFMDNEYSIDEDDDDEVFLHEVDIDGEWGRANAEQSVPKPSFVKDFVDNEDMYANSDEEQHLRRAPQSDEESTGRRFPEFNPSCDIGTVEFESEKYRIRAICVAENCPFEIYASKMQHEDTLQVKRLDPKHTCSRVWENKKVRSSWLAQTFVEEVKTNPTVPVVSLKATIQRNINSGISLSKVRRAKNKALKILEGSISAQYARLWDYATELRNTNPGTTVQIKCDFNALLQMPVFQRMTRWHLKSPYEGQLLSAVGLDANNMTWVIAYAQVEMETKDSWIWFLQLLVKDIELANQYGFTFISDKQKGLVETFQEVVPNCNHRFCARHLSTNFSLVYKGKLLKDAMCRAAFATTVPEFRRAMKLLRTLDGEAYPWLTAPERPPRHWSRSHFNTTLKCPILLNNLCESFNFWIMLARSKPIISMMEEIRVKLMRRIQMRRDLMMRWERAICPRPLAKLETSKKQVAACIAIMYGGPKFQVDTATGGQFIVDLDERTFSCRNWDLSGVSCKHVVSGINHKRGNRPDTYIDKCYMKETFLNAYENIIQPVNGMDLWERVW